MAPDLSHDKAMMTIPKRRTALRTWPAMALLLTSASLAQGAAPPAQVFIDNGELNYFGQLSEEANRRAFALFEAQAKKPAILSIRSTGGPTGPGMELGRWVHARGLTVKVMEFCFSSCANYVFTAAPRKVVSNHAVVAYHGGLSSTSFELGDEQEAALRAMPEDQRAAMRAKFDQAVRAMVAPQQEDERNFFAQIGVRQRITTLGQDPKIMGKAGEKAIGWTYSLAGFARLGVEQIRVINPPWRPTFVNSDATVTVLPD